MAPLGIARNCLDVPHHRDIDASDTNLSGPEFANVLQLSQLTDLHCTEARLTDAEFEVLGKITDLEVLSVNQNTPSEGVLKHLRGLKKLRSLAAGWRGLTGEELAALSGLPELRTLDLWGAPLTVAGWETMVNSLPKLTSIAVSPLRAGDTLTPAMIAPLGRLSRLERLTLHGFRVSDETMEAIAGLTEVKALDLTRIRTDAASYAHLAMLSDLEELRLEGKVIGDDHLQSLTEMKNLKRLVLAYTSVTAQAIADLRTALPELTVQQ